MTVPVLIARLTLCVVFAAAAWTKLADSRGTREAIVAFGAPAAIAGPLALVLPVAELATAALLLPAETAIAGAVASLGLLATFSAAISVNLARGRAPDCHCFGQLHSEPAGPNTLARNGILAAAAVLVVVGGGGPSAVAWIGGLRDSALVAAAAGVAIAATTAAFVSLLRAYGRALVRIDTLERTLADAGIAVDGDVALEVLPPQHGLAPATSAPGFTVSDVNGTTVSLNDLLAPGLPLMLVFASPHCGPCSALMPEVGEWQREHADRLTVAVASDGAAQDVRAEAEELALDHMLLDEAGLYEAFRANGTPSAVLIAANGTIASWIASGRDSIRGLMRGVVDASETPVGAPAPIVELESLDGEPVTLGEPSGADTLVLFWNPGCGFCRGMHEDVLAWERSLSAGGPRLVVVSSGDPERTREDRFRSTVVLDSQFSAGEAFGAAGTPSAVLLGADGRVASRLAVGARAVLGLANAEAPMIGVRT